MRATAATAALSLSIAAAFSGIGTVGVAAASSQATTVGGGGQLLPGTDCPAFPADNVSTQVANRPRDQAPFGNLRSNRLRPAGWTSADAAGLPILPGLVNYDEIKAGHIGHAIRFTAETTSTSYVWPARHQAGSTGSAGYPPMGARFRLRAGFKLSASSCARACQVVVQAMKTYGLILADNGSNWYFQGTSDRRWTYTMVDQLKAIPAREFQAVDEVCLMVSAGSGQARQPGTRAYQRACGRR